MALTNNQSTLIGFLNQLSQNLANDDPSVVSAGVDINLDLGGDRRPTKPTPPCPPSPGTPTTLREVLISLVNEQVQVTTPFGAVTGTLLSVNENYIVLLETSGDQVLIRIDKIEFINEQ